MKPEIRNQKDLFFFDHGSIYVTAGLFVADRIRLISKIFALLERLTGRALN